jgi:hypothetical protein
MTTPTGLLAWGQAGTYDAVDDRRVITALANRNQGLVVGAQITAGAGLQVSIAPGWLGVANCGDGTLAVVGSGATLTVDVPAGPATGSATYYLWCDVDPDGATWTINVITPADATGRPGIQLGTVVAPAGANLASQMTITNAPVTFGQFEGITLNTKQTGGKAYLYATQNGMLWVQSLLQGAGGAAVLSLNDGRHYVTGAGVNVGPIWTIPAGDAVPFTHYHLHSAGAGLSPSPAANMWFDVNGLGTYCRVTLDHGGWAAHTPYNYDIDAHVQVDHWGNTVAMSIRALVAHQSMPQVGIQGVGVTTNATFNPAVADILCLRSNAGSAGGTLETWNNTFSRHGGADPSGQISP